jgi:hypothetical protein
MSRRVWNAYIVSQWGLGKPIERIHRVGRMGIGGLDTRVWRGALLYARVARYPEYRMTRHLFRALAVAFCSKEKIPALT